MAEVISTLHHSTLDPPSTTQVAGSDRKGFLAYIPLLHILQP